jgi:hypothetical protein
MKLLSEKYIKAFLNINKKYDFNAVINRIIELEKSSEVQLLDWTEQEIGDYLRQFQSESPMALNRQLSVLRNFADYICKQENLPKKNFSIGEDKLNSFISYNDLLETTIDYEQYRHIKNQLDENVRDKLIFELAWYGLTNNMITMLKESDITFEMSDDFGWEIAFLNCQNLSEDEEDIDSDNRNLTIQITDPEVVEDIKACIKEQYHVISASDGRIKRMQYKDSEYLIKPINVGKTKKEDYISNPSLTLQKAFVAKEITCEGININKLSIARIRRSGLIYLLSPENESEYPLDLITILYGFKNDTGLYWLRSFAKEKYGSK